MNLRNIWLKHLWVIFKNLARLNVSKGGSQFYFFYAQPLRNDLFIFLLMSVNVCVINVLTNLVILHAKYSDKYVICYCNIFIV